MPAADGGSNPDETDAASETRVLDSQVVADHWAGHPIHGDIYTHGGHQFVAFYDEQRQMTVGQRELGDDVWEFVKLDEVVGWDSHNGINIVVGPDDHLHLSGNMHAYGNMHASPLVYFRTTDPLDVTSLERVDEMVGKQEESATYPTWFFDGDDNLVFGYRDGVSGDGVWYYNRYDPETRTWSRLLDEPLFGREGSMNAYFRGPEQGPDGFFHVVGMWRDTGDAATNHDLYYARSPDLVNWETAGGEPLELPLTIGDEEMIVDPVPSRGGLLNAGGSFEYGFDARDRVVISYHKHTGEEYGGPTQVFNARFEDGAWEIHQVTDWDYHWDFGGVGSLGTDDIEISGVYVEDGRLLQVFDHVQAGSGRWVLDEETLTPTETLPPGLSTRPTRLEEPRDIETEDYSGGLQVNWAESDEAPGKSCLPYVNYTLRWESGETNQDEPRQRYPDPVPLRLYTFIDRETRELDVEVDQTVDDSAEDSIPVTIRGDVDLDLDSLLFGPKRAVMACEGAPANSSQTDVRPGAGETVVPFSKADAGFEARDDTAVLTGRTADGTPVYGETTVDKAT